MKAKTRKTAVIDKRAKETVRVVTYSGTPATQNGTTIDNVSGKFTMTSGGN